jgi:hypothetical protein
MAVSGFGVMNKHGITVGAVVGYEMVRLCWLPNWGVRFPAVVRLRVSPGVRL